MGCAMIHFRPTLANARCDSCGSGDTDQIITISAERHPERKQAMWLCRACIENQLIPSLTAKKEER